MARACINCGGEFTGLAAVKGCCPSCSRTALREKQQAKAKAKLEAQKAELTMQGAVPKKVSKKLPEKLRKALERHEIEKQVLAKDKAHLAKRLAKKKGPSKKQLKRRDEDMEKFYAFASKMWAKDADSLGRVYSEESGVLLGYEFNRKAHGYCFSHILPASTHKEFYYHEDNYNWLTHAEHTKWGSSSERQTMKIWPKNKATIAKLLKESKYFRK